MDLLPIPKLGYLVSCAMDGKVALWSVSFVEQHGSGGGAQARRAEETKGVDGLPHKKVKI